MTGDVPSSSALVKRTGPSTRLIEGPKPGERSLYRQQVLDEDEYTEALSHIIGRDFFPNLPHIHATNAYLTALTNNDPELLSASIRRLAELAKEKEGEGPVGGSVNHEAGRLAEGFRQEFDRTATPHVAVPGHRHAARTPIGARGWDTPVIHTRDRSSDNPGYPAEDTSSSEKDEEAESYPKRPRKRKRSTRPRPPAPARTDLSLDAFQRNYTSEDNASFVQIVDQENRQRREERWDWAWKAEQQADARRIEGETKRRLILDAASNGSWRVDGDGRRMIGGLAQGGRDTADEAWREQKRITDGSVLAVPGASEANEAVSGTEPDDTRAMIPASQFDGTLVTTSAAMSDVTNLAVAGVVEQGLPSEHPLSKALVSAGLPPTALTSSRDGAVVPARESASGSGEGRGRGTEDRKVGIAVEDNVMGEDRAEHIPLAGSGGDQWGYKTRNNLFFPADANVAPYPVSRNIVRSAQSRQAPPSIAHANTRIQDEEEVRPADAGPSRSQRSSSPARSWVDAAVKGTPYRRRDADSEMPSINHYPLVAKDPSPLPQNLPSLLTWGTLMSTPRAIDGSQDPLDLSGPSFRLPESKRRDELGRKLADKASRAMKERAKGFTPRTSGSALSAALRSAAEQTQRSVRGKPATPGRMLPPSATPRRQADTLTPAARNLLQRSLGRSPLTRSGITGLNPSAGVRNRGAVMEKESGWSISNKHSKAAGKGTAPASWTPSPPHRSS